VKLKRHGATAGFALCATLALAACGSDNLTPPAAGTSGPSIACANGALTAQGSSAQGNAMAEWVKNYQQQCPSAGVNYQATASGAGITAFTDKTADFAGSDSALKAGDEATKASARCTGGQAIHLPMVIGPIAVVYNVPGVNALQLKPATLAKIFSGAVKTWDDPAIKADNASATLSSTPILPVHRSDSSGTTDNFTRYLGATAGSDWTFGNDKVWKAPGGQGEAKSDGVAAGVKKAAGAIGYVELSFAQVNSLAIAKIYNGAGDWSELSDVSAGNTVAGATVVGTGDDLSLKIDYNTKEAGAYPIVLVTYEIVCSKGNAADKVTLLKGFLGYTSSSTGQAALIKLGYAPLPSSLQSKVAATVSNLG
jgi:phosphate transport system substrate-binding protein